ncbi:hypothetical protein FSP39_010614 [Pinctada imbricata]|uniref:Protein kinase domain-containing protein n=1 Tax=Pinctada imbricata TaxID=66713 RepID=A0AA89BM69_PINIB|nr:hypothetical protein FSP39_010614 [Pinctada imbricata]
MFMCYEHLRRCTEKMIQIEEPKFFVGVCGIQLSTPPALVMENAQFGSLHRFFQQRKPDQPIYLHHLLTASIQIASGLLYLQEHNVYHGNICCHNILLFKYAIDEIHVKIGDPGMVSLLNTQSIDYEENRRRVPWLAPELLNDMNQMTTQSDMYAFGTTMWEMFSFGKNPVDTMFRQFDSTMISQRMQQHKLPIPESLVIKKNEDIIKENEDYIPRIKQKVVEVMRLCWESQPQNRPGANEMVRDLNSIMASYASLPPSNHIPTIPRQSVQNKRVPSIHSPSAIPSSPARKSETQVPSASISFMKGRPPMDPLQYLIPSKRLHIHNQVLGKGHYGEVRKGSLYKSAQDKTSPTTIAAKILMGEFQNVLDSPEFIKEAKLMAVLSHPHIVKFIGISDNKLILEYVENKSLSSFLRKQRETKTMWDVPKLVRISYEVAEGMKYLSSQKIIHCDLAGRNVLVTKEFQAKISDFGLAKELAKDKDYYTRSKDKDLPLLWCAPEAVSYRKFTIKSDIWSYGVLMWEIFTHGKTPRLSQADTKDTKQPKQHKQNQVDLLNNGVRYVIFTL